MNTVSVVSKPAIVTGAGGQIGGKIARALAGAGCNVVLADVDVLDTACNQQSSEEVHGTETAHRVADDIETMGRRAIVVECDLTKPDRVEAMIDRAAQEFGGITQNVI